MSKLSVTKLTIPVEGSVQGPLAALISDQKLAKQLGTVERSVQRPVADQNFGKCAG